MQFNREGFTDEKLISLYKHLLLPRMIEEKMLLLLRQGKISKWFSGIGQEAISVGATCALQSDEWIMPLHRNLGVFTGRGMPLEKLFMQWQGDENGYTKGRERSFHFGSREHYICGMISHLGPQLAVADGAALAYKLKKEKKVVLAFTGEGGTSEGDFHEALNVAAVWDLPVIFIIENNGYGLSTPVSEQFRCNSLSDKAIGYGMEGIQIDGNNVLTVYETIKGIRDFCLEKQKPYLVECMTFRMRGHEEASGTKYVPKEMFEKWMEKDPIKNYERFLVEENILTNQDLATIRSEIKERIREMEPSAKTAVEYSSAKVVTQNEIKDVYAPLPAVHRSQVYEATVGKKEVSLRFIDAIKQGLHDAMLLHPNLVLMGQDIAEYGGAFKITDGFVDEFGKERVRNTPLCESAIIGAALGLSLEGYKSVVEMQFADFVSVGLNQIVNNLAKLYYRWGQNADVVIRMPTGAG
ncbi:MAG: thiamine pyrophosphate-dependent enzyme, partial [Ginsengibacter sp.]